MQDPAQHFLVPENSTHRRYEALRALFVDNSSLDEAASRFGYAAGTLRNLRAAFLQQPHRPFFLPDRRGKRKPQPGPDRDERILALRNERNLSAAEIAAHLTAEEVLPGSAMIPPGCAFRALLALKLWGIGRPSRVMPEALDEGLALFAGLNAVPKRATLTEYSCRATRACAPH